MNPSRAAVAAIRAQVTDWSPTNDQIAATLNAPSVANPAPQGQVPKPFVAEDLVAACSAGNRPNLPSFLAGAAAGLIVAQDVTHLAEGLDALAGIGVISNADASAMKAVMTQTQPDPAWQSQISWAQANVGRPVDAQDIAASRP